MSRSALIRTIIAEAPGITFPEVATRLGMAERKRRTILGAQLSNLVNSGELERIHGRYYPSIRLIERTRGRPHAVRRLPNGRFYILGQRLTRRQAERLSRALAAALAQDPA